MEKEINLAQSLLGSKEGRLTHIMKEYTMQDQHCPVPVSCITELQEIVAEVCSVFGEIDMTQPRNHSN